jgi:hypothetical protein
MLYPPRTRPIAIPRSHKDECARSLAGWISLGLCNYEEGERGIEMDPMMPRFFFLNLHQLHY